MKNLIIVFALAGVFSCNEHVSKSLTAKTQEKLTCEGAVADRPSRAIVVDEQTISLVQADLQGRVFSKDAFWSRLSRESRLSLNLLLNSQIGGLNEVDVYKGAALFFERYTLNKSEKLEIVSAGTRVIFQDEAGPDRAMDSDCVEARELMKSVNIEKVIPASSIEHLATCEIGGETVGLEIYRNHLAVRLDGKIYGFGGGELIVNRPRDGYVAEGLTPEQQKLKLTFNLTEKSISLRISEPEKTFEGSGTCR